MPKPRTKIFLADAEIVKLAGKREAAAVKKLNFWPTLLTGHFAGLIDWREKNDPLRMQVIPRPEEQKESGCPDFNREQEYMVSNFLIHRYPDRAVLLASSRCFGHCRFCFRKSRWAEPEERIADQSIKAAAKYIKAHPEIRELIISGGDPLVLSNRELRELIRNFDCLAPLDLIRLASRALSFFPDRIDPGLIRILGKSRKRIWFVSHFNHPRELSARASASIDRLLKAGIPILNQTVLLKGINDSAEILSGLFSALTRLGVKPYYLFQCDPAKGAAHFATDLKKSLELVRNLSEISGIALPRFAFELPGFGKLSPGPNWKIEKQGRAYRISSPSQKVYFYPA